MALPPLTLLVITPVSGRSSPLLTAYSSRSITQTLSQISSISSSGGSVLGSQIRRDINGNLIDLTYAQFHKYASTITCTDQNAPALDDAWFGAVVEVACSHELGYLTAAGTPARTEVSGSSRTEGDFTYYRPLLTMMVTALDNSFDEWPSHYRWRMDLQET